MEVVLRLSERFASFHPLPRGSPVVVVHFCTPYSHALALKVLLRDAAFSHVVLVDADHYRCRLAQGPLDLSVLQICDFELTNWASVLAGTDRASSYVVRKGLSRKAQFSMQLRKYSCKRKDSTLHTAIPYTLILDVWSAFEEMKFDFGGGTFASFDMTLDNTPLRSKLEFVLEDVKEKMLHESRADWVWILKPSVANKGVGISLVREWDALLGRIEAATDTREWVLQRYIANPLLVAGHKFHIRTYVLCVGALRVFVFERMLLLLAAHAYSSDDLDDVYCHLTNTARAAELAGFDEEKLVLLDDDLTKHILADYPTKCDASEAQAGRIRDSIKEQIRTVTSEVFSAYENEYTVFCPMPNCFELYGLDFMVDDVFGVSLLEVNPGPDFQQTGARLQGVIESLFRSTFDIVINNAPGADDFSLVYDKEWSLAAHSSGMVMS